MRSSTSGGAIPFAEQNRIKDDSLQRTNRSLIWARSSSHAGAIGAPCSGMPFSRASQRKALFTLLLWFRSVLSVNPAGTWCSRARSARTAPNRAGITSSGLSNALAIWRKDVVQWRRVCFGRSFEAAMIAMAWTKEVSSRTGVWLIGIGTAAPGMDGDGRKYILWHFGNKSMLY